MAQESLQSAVEKAVETHKEELQTEQVETKEIEKPQETQQTQQTEQQPEVDLDAENGRILIQALRDPEKAGLVIDTLARQAGYTKPPETVRDVKNETRDITALIEKELGDEFKFLAPKLAPAIKAAVEELRRDTNDTSDLRDRLDRQELREIERETSETHVTISREYFGTDDMPANIVQSMSKAMDEFPPTDPNMSPSTYYRKIFYQVVGELGITKKQSRGQERERSKDAPVRQLTSQNRGITPGSIDGGNPKKMNLTDSIRAAVASVNQQMEK